MGADLITHILVWAGDFVTLTSRFQDVRQYANELHTQAMKFRNDEMDEDFLATTISEAQVLNMFEPFPAPLRELLRRWDGDDDQDMDEVLNYILHNTDEKILQANLKALNGVYVDENYRRLVLKGTTYTVLVAGAMSWGDEPDGPAYQAIKAMTLLGILDRLEVR